MAALQRFLEREGPGQPAQRGHRGARELLTPLTPLTPRHFGGVRWRSTPARTQSVTFLLRGSPVGSVSSSAKAGEPWPARQSRRPGHRDLRIPNWSVRCARARHPSSGPGGSSRSSTRWRGDATIQVILGAIRSRARVARYAPVPSSLSLSRSRLDRSWLRAVIVTPKADTALAGGRLGRRAPCLSARTRGSAFRGRGLRPPPGARPAQDPNLMLEAGCNPRSGAGGTAVQRFWIDAERVGVRRSNPVRAESPRCSTQGWACGCWHARLLVSARAREAAEGRGWPRSSDFGS